tara:strand:- start:228 stop:449 length:222 start_codon:yes stop_codon:yes gene_type:complete
MDKFKLTGIEGNNMKIDKKDFQKLLFINNAIENGWTVKKDNENYIFKKKHENKVEVFKKNYLEKFMCDNNNVI